MPSVKTLALGILLGVTGPGLHAQAQPATTTTKTAPQPQAKPPAASAAKSSAPSPTTQAKPAASTAGKPAPQAAKAAPAAKKHATKQAAKTPKPAVSAPAKPAEEREPKIARRDPFESLVGHEQGGGGKTGPLPPGKAGLQVSTLRLDGIVRAPNGMIAVVSNPQLRTYFLREGDQLYDGRVEKIAMDGVSFHEVGKDAFGKPVERQVNKRIYASAGEQQ